MLSERRVVCDLPGGIFEPSSFIAALEARTEINVNKTPSDSVVAGQSSPTKIHLSIDDRFGSIGN